MYYKHVKKDSESLEPVWMGWRINIKFLQFFVNMYIFNSSPSQGKKLHKAYSYFKRSLDNYEKCKCKGLIFGEKKSTLFAVK